MTDTKLREAVASIEERARELARSPNDGEPSSYAYGWTASVLRAALDEPPEQDVTHICASTLDAEMPQTTLGEVVTMPQPSCAFCQAGVCVQSLAEGVVVHMRDGEPPEQAPEPTEGDRETAAVVQTRIYCQTCSNEGDEPNGRPCRDCDHAIGHIAKALATARAQGYAAGVGGRKGQNDRLL